MNPRPLLILCVLLVPAGLTLGAYLMRPDDSGRTAALTGSDATLDPEQSAAPILAVPSAAQQAAQAAPEPRTTGIQAQTPPGAGLTTEPVQPRIVASEAELQDGEYPPAGGRAALLEALHGDASEIALAHAKHSEEERRARARDLEAALEEYAHGEPKDVAGAAKYAAFKHELAWLRANPIP